MAAAAGFPCHLNRQGCFWTTRKTGDKHKVSQRVFGVANLHMATSLRLNLYLVVAVKRKKEITAELD